MQYESSKFVLQSDEPPTTLAPPRDPPPPELPLSQPPDLTTAATALTASAGYYHTHVDHAKEKEKKKGRFKIFGSKR